MKSRFPYGLRLLAPETVGNDVVTAVGGRTEGAVGRTHFPFESELNADRDDAFKNNSARTS